MTASGREGGAQVAWGEGGGREGRRERKEGGREGGRESIDATVLVDKWEQRKGERERKGGRYSCYN